MLMRRPRLRPRALLPLLAALALLGPLGWMWASSFAPSVYSATDTGYVDDGGAPLPGGHDHAGHAAGGTPVASLTGNVDGPADVAVTLVARQERFRLAGGEEVDGYTLNGTSPGPTLHVPQGKLLEVRLVNESVAGGTTLHWHGVAVPNADDGVAGVTQDAVPVGGSHVYRFRPGRAGTFWYHAHQLSPRPGRARAARRAGRGPAGRPVTSGIEAPGDRAGHGRHRADPRLRRAPHRRGPLRGRAGRRRARGARARAGDQHRQRADAGVGRRRPLPAARRRRQRRARARAGRRGPPST